MVDFKGSVRRYQGVLNSECASPASACALAASRPHLAKSAAHTLLVPACASSATKASKPVFTAALPPAPLSLATAFLKSLPAVAQCNLPRVWERVEGGLCEPLRPNVSHDHPTRVGGDYDEAGPGRRRGAGGRVCWEAPWECDVAPGHGGG
jgi:hypothetical protein